jgi:hypothetical protein
MKAFHQVLCLRAARLADDHLLYPNPAERHRLSAPSRPTANTLGAASRRLISHKPAYRSCADRDGISIAEANRE